MSARQVKRCPMHRRKKCMRCGHAWVSPVRIVRVNYVKPPEEQQEYCPSCQSWDINQSIPENY